MREIERRAFNPSAQKPWLRRLCCTVRRSKQESEDDFAAITINTTTSMTVHAPLQLLQRLLREHASANALSRQQQAVLQEGLRIIQAWEAAVEKFMRELLLLKQPGSEDAALVDADNKLYMIRLVRWFLQLVEEGVFRWMAARAR